MNSPSDAARIQSIEAKQAGVFSKADLVALFGERHPAAVVRRISAQLDSGVLRRFCRGWYVGCAFDPATLCQRLVPQSYVSFATVLAQAGIIGTRPSKQITAVRIGRPRKYAGAGLGIEYVSTTSAMFTGFEVRGGVRFADAEKAVLDTLYFHLRGRSYAFDLYSDLALEKLEKPKLLGYLSNYNNPKFVAFAKGFLELK